jgi:multiple sugar transport system permease protein
METKSLEAKTLGKNVGRLFLQVFLILVGLLYFAPFLWMFSTSLRLAKDSFSLPPALFPTAFEIGNYFEVFNKVPFFSFFLNSFKVAVVVALGNVIFSSMAAYSFARIRFPGRNILFLVLLSGLMITNQVTAIPQFILMAKLHMIDNTWTLVLLWLVNPLGIFLIRQQMMAISDSYEEAALMDGANRWWIYSRIMVPMSVPAISVSTVLWFVANWNDFFRPLLFINTWENMTLPLGMTALTGAVGSGNYSAVLAGVMLSLLPCVVIYIFGQRYLLEGLSTGGLKQ